jgi:hypothetical protein
MVSRDLFFRFYGCNQLFRLCEQFHNVIGEDEDH